MKNKKVIVTLAAAMTIVIAIVYTMSQLGGGSTGPGSRGMQNAKSSERSRAGELPSKGEKPDGTRRPPVVGENAPDNKKQGDTAPDSGTLSERGEQVQSDVAEVGVVKVKPATYRAKIKGYGEAVATYSLTLSAQVSGQITELSNHFKTGALLQKGEVLAYIDDTSYKQALASAQASYQNAYVALEEERLQGIQAKDEWARSGLEGEPESALVLREPQLQAAKADLREAEQNVAAAKRDLSFTKITTPFNALVVNRNVQPGSYVQVGTEVATLYSSDQAEISIPLSPAQWAQLPHNAIGVPLGWSVRLTDTTGTQHWSANIERIELHQDEETRQRRAIAVVENPLEKAEPLLFGTFLVAEIDGRELNNVWKIPSSAISQKQEVWYVNPDKNVLNNFTPTVLFEYEGYAYIAPFANMEEAFIVSRPLNNYLVNTRVNPVVEGEPNE